MTSYVVDASACLLLVLEQRNADAFRAWRRQAILRKDRLLAPTLLPYEIGNVLLREFADEPGARDPALTQILFSVELEVPDFAVVFAAAGKLGFYDAAYLALARASGSTLVTYDAELRRAAAAMDVKATSPGAA